MNEGTAPRGAAKPEMKSSGKSGVRPATQRRIETAFYLLMLPLLALGGKLVFLQGVNGGAQTTDFVREKTKILPARRADILAADGTAMAVTLDEYTICANPRAIKQKEKMARLLAENLGGDAEKYAVLLNKIQKPDGSPNFYVRLAKNVDEARVEKLKKRMGPQSAKEKARVRLERRAFWSAISFESSPRRAYPVGDFASQLVGFTAGSGRGVVGLENSFNAELGGEPGEITSQVDGNGRPIPGFVGKWRQPVNGQTVVTTIEPEIQADADATLRDLVKKYKPNFAVALVMRPKTGEIVAMSTAPSFDLNKRPKDISQVATNRVTQFAYEPGSTFKVITAAAAIENVPDWQSKSFVSSGAEKVGRHVIHDWTWWGGKRGSDDKTLSEGFRDSSNICMYHFARLVGAPTMLQYAKNFGLDERIDSDGLRGPRGWLADDPKGWSAEQLANFSFGQGMTMTPLQLGRVVSTIANDGVMMKPLLVKQLRDEEGKVIQNFKPQVERRVIQSQTARAVRDMMMRVTREGTARKFVFVPGYLTAGKTGSAQKAVGKRGYAEGRFISSLVGFVPAHQPQYVILVMADEPRGSHWGSEVCGPAWAKIAQKAMLHLRLRDGAAAPAPDPRLMKQPEIKSS